MRKVVVSNIMSLDGYVEGPGGNVMVLPMDGFFDEYNLERQGAADTLLLGATSYQGLKGYWPAVADNPDVADLHREIGQRNNELRKVVVSDALTEADTAPWTDTTTIVRRAAAHQAVAQLKEQPGRDILMFGAAVLGGGTPAFGAGPVPPVRLVNNRRREGSETCCCTTRWTAASRECPVRSPGGSG